MSTLSNLLPDLRKRLGYFTFSTALYLVWLLTMAGVFRSPILNSPIFGLIPTLVVAHKVYDVWAGNRKRKYLKHAFWVGVTVVLSLMILTTLLVRANDPSTIGTSAVIEATMNPPQRKSFGANGRFWVFYSNGSHIICKSDTDGEDWSDAVTTIVREDLRGWRFSVDFDGTYLHYAYSSMASGAAIYHRRGTPETDGSITWSTDENTAVAGATNVYKGFPHIAVDSNGYPWIGYSYADPDITYFLPYIVKATATNGSSWGTPTQLSGVDAATVVVPVPLTAGKLYAVYTRGTTQIRGRLWNGTDWEAEETCTEYGTVHYDKGLSVVNEGDDVHLVYLRVTTYQIRYNKRTYGTGWASSDTLVQDSVDASCPVLSIHTTTNNLYCFWSGSPSTDCVYYKKCVSGTWDADPTLWLDESTDHIYYNYLLTCFYKSFGSKIGLVYVTKISSPFNVRFAYLLVPAWTVTTTTTSTYTSESTSTSITTLSVTITTETTGTYTTTITSTSITTKSVTTTTPTTKTITTTSATTATWISTTTSVRTTATYGTTVTRTGTPYTTRTYTINTVYTTTWTWTVPCSTTRTDRQTRTTWRLTTETFRSTTATRLWTSYGITTVHSTSTTTKAETTTTQTTSTVITTSVTTTTGGTSTYTQTPLTTATVTTTTLTTTTGQTSTATSTGTETWVVIIEGDPTTTTTAYVSTTTETTTCETSILTSQTTTTTCETSVSTSLTTTTTPTTSVSTSVTTTTTETTSTEVQTSITTTSTTETSVITSVTTTSTTTCTTSVSTSETTTSTSTTSTSVSTSVTTTTTETTSTSVITSITSTSTTETSVITSVTTTSTTTCTTSVSTSQTTTTTSETSVSTSLTTTTTETTSTETFVSTTSTSTTTTEVLTSVTTTSTTTCTTSVSTSQTTTTTSTTETSVLTSTTSTSTTTTFVSTSTSLTTSTLQTTLTVTSETTTTLETTTTSTLITTTIIESSTTTSITTVLTTTTNMTTVGSTTTTTITTGATTVTVTITYVAPPPTPPKQYALIVHVIDLFGMNAPDLTVKIMRVLDNKLMATSTTDSCGLSGIVKLATGQYYIDIYYGDQLQLHQSITLTEDTVIRMQIGIPVILTFTRIIIGLLIVAFLIALFILIRKKK